MIKQHPSVTGRAPAKDEPAWPDLPWQCTRCRLVFHDYEPCIARDDGSFVCVACEFAARALARSPLAPFIGKRGWQLFVSGEPAPADNVVQRIDEARYTNSYWLGIRGRECFVAVETRPHYCDRGALLAKLFPIFPLSLGIDDYDGWPRYYFDGERARLEVEAWLKKRGQWLAEGEEPRPWKTFGVDDRGAVR